MAKLSAHGVEELRMVKTESSTAPGGMGLLIAGIVWRKRFLSIRSDGYIMMKDQVRLAADLLNDERTIDYGWKRWRKAEPGYKAIDLRGAFEAKGYVVVGGRAE